MAGSEEGLTGLVTGTEEDYRRAAAWVVERREEDLELTQAQLLARTHAVNRPVSQSFLTAVEHGRGPFTRSKLRNLSLALEWPADTLARAITFGEEPPFRTHRRRL